MQCRRQAAEPHLGGIAKCLQDSRQNVRKAAYEALKRHIEARSQSVVAAVEAIGTNDPDGFARKLLEEIGQEEAEEEDPEKEDEGGEDHDDGRRWEAGGGGENEEPGRPDTGAGIGDLSASESSSPSSSASD
mmetsp:Transcript_37319/g.120242  ORF Transcript_37319/g.120242 Transcript_37319/m.120242 type:complete len:132 (+) Transcript_37319:998-1393(+)